MNSEQGIGKGNDEHLREYQKTRYRKRIAQKLVVPVVAGILLGLLLFLILHFAFVVKTVEVQGETEYSVDELLPQSGFALGDNMIAISEKSVEQQLKEAFPYIKSVSLEKDFPSRLVLTLTEETTTFSYESQGEYFLFNHDFRLMDKFDSYDSLMMTREAIMVKMPVPKNYIVPQYIQMRDEDQYVMDVIKTLSESELVDYVNEIDLTDRFVLRMHCGKNVTVELGDFTNLEGKFSALYRLLGSDGSKMSGNVDLSCYPRCFYALREENDG